MKNISWLKNTPWDSKANFDYDGICDTLADHLGFGASAPAWAKGTAVLATQVAHSETMTDTGEMSWESTANTNHDGIFNTPDNNYNFSTD